MFASHLREDSCCIKATQRRETLQNLSRKLLCGLPTCQRIKDIKGLRVKGSFRQATDFFHETCEKNPKTQPKHRLELHIFYKKNKKAFSDGAVFKEAMVLVANTVFKDEKHCPEVISALTNV